MEDVSRYVFTTKHVAFRGSPILHVYHDVDGDWQFMGNEVTREEDATVLLLSEIIEMDRSVASVLKMPPGSKATRASINETWVITGPTPNDKSNQG